MANVNSDVQHQTLSVREFASNVKVARRLHELWDNIVSPLFDAHTMAPTTETAHQFQLLQDACKKSQQQFLDVVEGNDDATSMRTDIERFQQHCLEYFNESYHTLDKYMLLPLLAKNEMQKDELFLATVGIL